MGMNIKQETSQTVLRWDKVCLWKENQPTNQYHRAVLENLIVTQLVK